MVTDTPKCTDCETEVDQEGRDLLRDLFAGHVRHVFEEFIIKRQERLGTWPTAPNVDQMIEIIVSETLMPMCSKCFLERNPGIDQELNLRLNGAYDLVVGR